MLLVEDDDLVRKVLHRALATAFHVLSAATIDDALDQLQAHAIDVVVTDLLLRDPAGRDGWWLLERVDVPALLLTGSLVDSPAPNVLRKPISPRTLIERIHAAAAQASA